jgi:hypothetical protein
MIEWRGLAYATTGKFRLYAQFGIRSARLQELGNQPGPAGPVRPPSRRNSPDFSQSRG